jgi:hypothetical protein
MIDSLRKKNQAIIRQALVETQHEKIEVDNQIIDDAVSYFERIADQELIKTGMKDRFATGIARAQNITGDDESGYETYRKGANAEAIDQGIIEVVTSGVGSRIASSLANLFTSETQVWSYTDESGEATKQAEDAETLIKKHREHGGFSTALVNADFLSVAINGCLLYVDIRGDYLKYHVVSPSCFYSIFNETVIDGGVERAVDYSEIEDATVIVLRLSGPINADPTKEQYLAIFGRSKVYPYGRHVTYRAAHWDSIPDPGDADSHDYRLPNDELANPLSYLAATNPDESLPDYPIITINGGLTKVTNQIVTTSTSLYENCVEIDMAYSGILRAANNSARGVEIIKNEGGGSLPRNVTGLVSLTVGQTMELNSHPASNAQGAMDVLESAVVSVSGGYSVPGYMVVSGPTWLGDTSGVALMIRTAPLTEKRRYRIALNSPEIARLWQIESGLLRVYLGSEAEYLKTIEQSWDAGQYVIPEDSKVKTERLGMAQDREYIDYVAAVKAYHNLATDAQAEALITKYNDRKEEFPAPGAQSEAAPAVRQAQPVGLTFGR